MRVVITGGRGLIGGALARDLAGAGHEVVVLSRRPSPAAPKSESKAKSKLRTVAWDGVSPSGWGDLVEGPDTAIVHLAGEGIADGRWSEERKRRIRDSRTKSTEAVVAAIRGAKVKPRVLVQGSAVGYYGARGDERVTEDHALGTGFLAEVCAAWESASAEVEALGVRRAVLRTGVVLAKDGGALPKMALPFRLFGGGPVGHGRQWVPWIHLEDEVRAIRFLLETASARGVFNLTAPNPARNRDLSRALGKALHRPSLLPAPGFALHLALGEMADLLLEGQKAVPQALLAAGFAFRYPDLQPALDQLLGRAGG